MTLQEVHIAVDKLEAEIKQHPSADCPVTHIFTPMLYTRHIFMPAGTLIVSKIHKYQHPYTILSGVAWVKINDGEWVKLEGPHFGITEPGTRRVLFIEKDCWWITNHVTDVWPENDSDESIEEAVKKIENLIIMPREKLIFNNESELIDI